MLTSEFEHHLGEEIVGNMKDIGQLKKPLFNG
jgi:hypothetical protein